MSRVTRLETRDALARAIEETLGFQLPHVELTIAGLIREIKEAGYRWDGSLSLVQVLDGLCEHGKVAKAHAKGSPASSVLLFSLPRPAVNA
jgi:hypothetical protein